MWILLIVIGTFIRGPGWIWFWPGQTWDHNAVVFDKNVDLHDMIATELDRQDAASRISGRRIRANLSSD